MEVPLTPELERRISDLVTAGLYQSPAEVVRDGLRLLFKEEDEYRARLEALRREVEIGFAELERGEYVEMDEELLERIKREGRELKRQRRSA